MMPVNSDHHRLLVKHTQFELDTDQSFWHCVVACVVYLFCSWQFDNASLHLGKLYTYVSSWCTPWRDVSIFFFLACFRYLSHHRKCGLWWDPNPFILLILLFFSVHRLYSRPFKETNIQSQLSIKHINFKECHNSLQWVVQCTRHNSAKKNIKHTKNRINK